MSKRRTITGTLDDGTNVLVETYPDGTATIATRLHSWDVWGRPSQLTAQPLAEVTQ